MKVQHVGSAEPIDEELEAYLDNEARNIAEEFPGYLSPVQGSSYVTSPNDFGREPRIKLGLVNDGQPVKRQYNKGPSFIEDAQFEFNTLEKELQKEKKLRNDSMFNTTQATKPLNSLLIDPESKKQRNAFGQTQVRFKDMDDIEDQVTGRQLDDLDPQQR